MPYISAALPRIQDPVIDHSLFSVTELPDRHAQAQAAESVVAHWQRCEWPADLVSLHLYTSTDGRRVLTYAQCSGQPVTARTDDVLKFPDVPNVDFAPYVPYRLYRAVGGGLEHGVEPRCFPIAFFDVGDQSASGWIDGLLGHEERSAGSDRTYPGAVSANFHISTEGHHVLIFSEWTTEEHAASHMKSLINGLLSASPVKSSDPNTRYERFVSVRR
jgi:hypothetical protein